MESLFVVNAVLIGIGIIAFVLPARSFRKRFEAAKKRLQEAAVDQEMLNKFDSVYAAAGRRAQKWYWLCVIAALIGGGIVTQIIVMTIESRANAVAWLLGYTILMGVGALGFLIMMGVAFSRMLQLRDISRLLREAETTHPDQTVFYEAGVMVGAARGEIGTSAISLIAMIGALISGLGLIAFFFGIAQTAIACARSSKCI